MYHLKVFSYILSKRPANYFVGLIFFPIFVKIMSVEYVCPKCGNKDNLHYNYDWSKQHRPIIDVLCNECGEFFGEPIDNSTKVERAIIQWSNDGTKTAGTLTREIFNILKLKY